MADSIREKIIQKLVDDVADILTTNGYQTDIGQNVYRAYHPGLSTPSIVVVPQTETITRTGYRTDEHRFPVRFEGIDTFDEANIGASKTGEKIYSDIVKCLFAISWGSGDPQISRILWTEGGVAEYPAPRDEYVGAYATINLIFDTKIGDPFSQ